MRMVLLTLALLAILPASANDGDVEDRARLDALILEAEIYICAHDLIKNVMIVAGSHLAMDPSEIADAIRQDRTAVEQRVNAALRPASEALANIIHALIVTPDDKEHAIVEICVKNLKE